MLSRIEKRFNYRCASWIHDHPVRSWVLIGIFALVFVLLFLAGPPS